MHNTLFFYRLSMFFLDSSLSFSTSRQDGSNTLPMSHERLGIASRHYRQCSFIHVMGDFRVCRRDCLFLKSNTYLCIFFLEFGKY